MSFKETFFKIMGFKKKEPRRPGVIGYYDSRPFDSFKYSLIYANEKLISESDDEKTANVIVYTREYKQTTFINVLVYNEEGFDPKNYTYDVMKRNLLEYGITPAKNSVILILFQHYNDETVKMAKSFCNSDKEHFEQALVYNAKEVRMEFYKPVPTFYRLYSIMCEDLFFDLAFIDDSQD
jgi:hypothetical protein